MVFINGQTYAKTAREVAAKTRFLQKYLNLEWNRKLEKDIRFTRLKVNAEEVTLFAWFSTLFTITLSLLLSILTSMFTDFNPLLVVTFGLTISLFILYYLTEYPSILASKKRTGTLGQAPEVVAYLIIPLKQNPNLESAVEFAATYSEGELSREFKRILWENYTGKYKSIGQALPSLAGKYKNQLPGFQDALYCIRASQLEKSESRRLDYLDKALDSVLCGIRESFRQFIEYLRLPTMILFAAGAILPLVVIIMLPLASFLGADIGTPVNITLMLAFILLATFLFSQYTLTKRPAAFPIRDIPDEHPDLPKKGKMHFMGREIPVKEASLWCFFLPSLFSIPYLVGWNHWLATTLNTLPLVIGFSAGLFVYLAGTSYHKKKIRDKIKKEEKQILQAAHQLGNRLLSGMAAEEALIKVAGMIEDEENGACRIMKDAVRNIRYMNANLEDAFFDEKIGALRNTYSAMITSLFQVFVNSMKKSIRSSSESLLTAANHIQEIHKVEENLKNKLSYTTSMMKVTALAITPGICGLTVYISKVFEKTTEATENLSTMGMHMDKIPTSPEILQLLVGVYMILLLVVLIRFTTILERGDDRVQVDFEIAQKIPIALSIYLGVLFISQIFV